MAYRFGASGSMYENSKGVVITMRSKTEGVELKLGLGILNITLAVE